MDVFRIRLDSNEFQSFLPANPDIWKTSTLKMDCERKSSAWKSPEIYIQNPKRKVGNFFHLCSGAFVVDSDTTEKLRAILEMAGELLPLLFEGKVFYLSNVLECMNCLDENKTEWVLGQTTGKRIRIKEYHFNKNRMPESSIFKIPETAAGEILCSTGVRDTEDEFKSQVETLGLNGLIFEKLWSA